MCIYIYSECIFVHNMYIYIHMSCACKLVDEGVLVPDDDWLVATLSALPPMEIHKVRVRYHSGSRDSEFEPRFTLYIPKYCSTFIYFLILCIYVFRLCFITAHHFVAFQDTILLGQGPLAKHYIGRL